jgi:3-hydroxypropionate dehydrogenase (NADP+)
VTLPKKIACVGSGTIGSSWALLYAMKDYDVITYDVNEEALANSTALIKNMLGTLVENGIVKKSRVKRILGKIRATTGLDDVADYEYIQESALERLDVKIELLGKLERIVSKDVIIASSTSGLSMTTMQKSMKHPERALIAHPFNPPHLVPLVEIVRGEKTSPATVSTVYELMKSLDKVPVRINKQLPGFAANRLQIAVLRESLAMLADGVVDADGLEKIMSAGIGLRWAFMGPIVTADLAGGAGGMEYYLEHFGPLIKSVCETLSTWTTVPEPVKEETKRQTGELSLIKNKSYAELVKWRDQNLIAVLKDRGYL